MRNIALFIVAFCVHACLFAQNKAATYMVRDSLTQVAVRSCRVMFDNKTTEHTTVTDDTGCFNSPVGATTVTISHVAYEPKQVDLRKLNGNTIYIVPKNVALKEATITSTTSNNHGSEFSYNARQAASTISIIGEPDVIRHTLSLPGTSFGMEGTLGIFVRGGDTSGNGLYFDGVPLYVTSHLLGLFSVIPPEMADKADFYKGGLPATSGSYSSALISVSPQNNYGTPSTGKAYISPYLCGLHTSLPLIKDKMSVRLSARTTILPYILNWMNKTNDKLRVDLYDLCVKLDYKPNLRNTFSAFYFHTNDLYEYTQYQETRNNQAWKATATKLQWDTKLSEQTSFNFLAYHTSAFSIQETDYFAPNSSDTRSHVAIASKLKEWALRAMLTHTWGQNVAMRAGLSFQNQRFTNGTQRSITSERSINNVQTNPSTRGAVFAETDLKFAKRADLKLGLRGNVSFHEEQLPVNIDLHALSHWYFRPWLGVELAYDRLNQFHHILEGLPTGWPLNIRVPSNKYFPNEQTNQFYAGTFIKKTWTEDRKINATIGAYYRKMDNLLSYTNPINAFGLNTSTWEEEATSGTGRSFGLEASSAIILPTFTASLAYTLSKTTRTYPSINYGRTFPYKFDRRHILNCQLQYAFVRRVTRKGTAEHNVACNIAFASGNRLTLPIGTYQGIAPPHWKNLSTGYIHPDEYYRHIYDRQQMSDINAISIKNYFRTDLAYNYISKRRKHTRELSLSVFNVFNRHNPYALFHEDNQWKQVSIVPIMPMIRWSISW